MLLAKVGVIVIVIVIIIFINIIIRSNGSRTGVLAGTSGAFVR